MVAYHIKMIKINLINQQNKYQIQEIRIKKLLSFFISEIHQKTNKYDEISIIIINDDKMIDLNKTYFNKNSTTDVISFLYDPIPGEQNLYSGDIIINLDKVVNEGKIRNNMNYELGFYLAHGFDHLNGNKDNTYIKRLIMHKREKKWLKNADKLNLLDNLILD